MLAAGAIAGSIALGAGAGALLFTPTVSLAQDGTTTTTAAENDAGSVRHHRFARGMSLEVAAEAIGISADDLRSELEDGKTIAEVAEAHDVDVQDVIDALVADGKERLAEAEEALPERIKELVNSDLPIGRGGPRHGGLIHAGLDTVSTAIGISESELRDELQDDKTIADVAKAHDVDPQKVIDAVVAEATKRIDAAVADDEITEERAASLKENLVDHATRLVNETRPPGGRGPRGLHHQVEGDGTASSVDPAVYALS
jgi:urease gamma subunit